MLGLSDYDNYNMENGMTFRRARSEENVYARALMNPHSGYEQRNFSINVGNCYSQPLMVPASYFPFYPPHYLAPHSFPAHALSMQRRHYLRNPNWNNNSDGVSEILKVLSKRVWQEIGKKQKSDSRHFEFTLMSYNVLAQDLLNEHLNLYKNHDRKALNWDTRWRNLFNEIKVTNPDILCMQEVQQSHLHGYYNQLKTLGYKGLYKKRTGLRCDGCAIYYKHNKLRLVEYETVEFFQPNITILNRDNIAIIAKFCPSNSPNRQFIVATTHLLYNPKREDVRLAQTQLLLTEVERMSFHWNQEGKQKYWPIIISGDFNSTPESAIYSLITKGSFKYDNLASKKLDRSDSPKHGKILVPSNLQITDTCQHACLMEKRQNGESMSRREETALIKLHNSEKTVGKIARTIENPELFCSGTLRHLFALKSVYKHGEPCNPEGSTYQDEWITVDYIFYGGKKRGAEIKNHDLKLVSIYKLPLKDEFGTVSIPNSLMGSDHLPLVAKFKLLL